MWSVAFRTPLCVCVFHPFCYSSLMHFCPDTVAMGSNERKTRHQLTLAGFLTPPAPRYSIPFKLYDFSPRLVNWMYNQNHRCLINLVLYIYLVISNNCATWQPCTKINNCISLWTQHTAPMFVECIMQRAPRRVDHVRKPDE